MSSIDANMTRTSFDPVDRALQSRGISEQSIYQLLASRLSSVRPAGGTLVDVGCGVGDLMPHVRKLCDRYVGADIVRHDRLAGEDEFVKIDVESGRIPLDDESVDVVCAIEVISMIENPRAFVRELVRIVKPGGWVFVSTVNNLSLLNLITLVARQRYQAFQDALYPMQITALLEVDLHRMAREAGLADVATTFTARGRVPFSNLFYPGAIARLAPRWLSDLVLMESRKPDV
jgi:2-polyprenyl-3-methyl-5-hydroxy-6-metoxy-1,4-benzoquinol methylase